MTDKSGLVPKTLWTTSDIRSRLSQPGVGFVFHAIERDSIFLVCERNGVSDAVLWDADPIIGSPIFFESRLIGCHIISPLYASMWASNAAGVRHFRRRAFEPALSIASECGLSHVGLGALVPFATKLGLAQAPPGSPKITTGHAATVVALGMLIGRVGEALAIDRIDLDVAIFGAAGSIGSTVAVWLAHTGVSHVRLIEVPERLGLLNEVTAKMRALAPAASVDVCTPESIRTAPNFDVGLVATSRTDAWMDIDLLHKACVWIDDSHPKAIKQEAADLLRGKALCLECYLRGPQGLSQTISFPLPTARDCYSCFAEAFVCWKEGFQSDFVKGLPTLDQLLLMEHALPKHGFAVGPFASKGGEELARADIDAVGRRARARKLASLPKGVA